VAICPIVEEEEEDRKKKFMLSNYFHLIKCLMFCILYIVINLLNCSAYRVLIFRRLQKVVELEVVVLYESGDFTVREAQRLTQRLNSEHPVAPVLQKSVSLGNDVLLRALDAEQPETGRGRVVGEVVRGNVDKSVVTAQLDPEGVVSLKAILRRQETVRWLCQQIVRVRELDGEAGAGRVVPEGVRPEIPVENVCACVEVLVCGQNRAGIVMDGAIVDVPVDLGQRCPWENFLFSSMRPENGIAVSGEVHPLEPDFLVGLSKLLN
jgi:hypothetical protein